VGGVRADASASAAEVLTADTILRGLLLMAFASPVAGIVLHGTLVLQRAWRHGTLRAAGVFPESAGKE
jgi:hypothetical protein